MATKAQKRAAGEVKAKREAEERRQSGLAAQRADKQAREAKEKRMDESASAINQRHRSTLLKNGINPSTGLIFTDDEMAEMDRKANTSERRHLFNQIKAGRAGLLDEQPVQNTSDYDPFFGMTVGEFRDMMDKKMETWVDARRGRRPELTPQFLSASEVPTECDKHPGVLMEWDGYSHVCASCVTRPDAKQDTRFPARLMETQAALHKFTS